MGFDSYATFGGILCKSYRLCGWNNYPGAHTMQMSPKTGILIHTYEFCAQNWQRRVAEVGCRL